MGRRLGKTFFGKKVLPQTPFQKTLMGYELGWGYAVTVENEGRVFQCSDAWVRRSLLHFCLMPVGLGVSFIAFDLGRKGVEFFSFVDLWTLGFSLPTILLMTVIPAIMWWSGMRVLRASGARVEEGQLIAEGASGKLPSVDLSASSKAIVKRDPSGNVVLIILAGPEGKRWVCGFEEMNALAGEVLSSLPESCLVTTSTIRSAMGRPFPPSAVAALLVWVLFPPLAFLMGRYMSLGSILYVLAALAFLGGTAATAWKWWSRGRFPVKYAVYTAVLVMFVVLHMLLFSYIESRAASLGISFMGE